MSKRASLQAWVGRTRTERSLATPWQADVFAASLDRDDPPYRDGDPIPSGWHWFYFPEAVRRSETGADGHAAKGDFLPPVALPRRMWAGNRMCFQRPLRVGDRLQRDSRIIRVDSKQGRHGELCFVTVRHEIRAAGELATIEEHDIVYRAPPVAGENGRTRPDVPVNAEWRRVLTPDPVLLFRFSALTMNAHRIHYDREFCRQEGYAGLLVHGPLTMLLLMELLREHCPEARLHAISMRATAPVVDAGELRLAGRRFDERTAALWALNAEGELAMRGEAELA